MTKKAAFQLLALSAIWSAYFICVQNVNTELGVILGAAAFRFGTVFVMLCCLVVNRHLSDLIVPRKAVVSLLIVGLLSFILDGAAFIGFQHCNVSEGTALLKCDIIFVNLISAVIYKKSIPLKNWLLTIFMLVGVFILVGVDFKGINISNPYYFMFILSAFAVSCNAFILQNVQSHYPEINDMVIAFYNVFVSGLLFVGTLFITHGYSFIQKDILNASWLLVLLLGCLLSVGLFALYYDSLRKLPVWTVKIFLLTMPAISSFASFLLYGEVISIRQASGIAVICVGAFLIITSEKKEPAVWEKQSALHSDK